METIKNYIESMFRNLPQTEKVLRAKSELFQMMEDKYTELIREGKTENEAVGTVISEFGNLEEISVDLGIADVFKSTREDNINRRKLTFDEIKGFVAAKSKNALLLSLGVFLSICCVVPPIVTDCFRISDNLGAIGLFIVLAISISFYILASSAMDEYKFIYEEDCSIDAAEREYLNNKRREFSNKYAVLLSIGISLCILSIVPPIALDDYGILEDLSAAFLFIFVGAGVFMITYANTIKNSYEQILCINTKRASKNHKNGRNGNAKYSNKTVAVIMSVYWQTITCIYLVISFMTGSWHLTWLIWPIAGVVCGLLRAIYANTED